MPLSYVHYPAGAFSDAARDALAEERTTIGLECEKQPDTPFVRSFLT